MLWPAGTAVNPALRAAQLAADTQHEVRANTRSTTAATALIRCSCDPQLVLQAAFLSVMLPGLQDIFLSLHA
jgi:hypothetical protein